MSVYHKAEKANNVGSQEGQVIDFFGCKTKVKKIRLFQEGGKQIRHVVLSGGKGERLWSNNCGPGSSKQPYVKNINCGNGWSTIERQRSTAINSKTGKPDIPICYQEQTSKVIENFRKLVNETWKNLTCSDSTARPKAVANLMKEPNCYDQYGCAFRGTPANKRNLLTGKDAAGNRVNYLDQCEASGGTEKRICRSMHCVGRAWDAFWKNSNTDGIFAGLPLYTFPDPYWKPNWDVCVVQAWFFWAHHAHYFNICNISNEGWHWQHVPVADAKPTDTVVIEKTASTQTETDNQVIPQPTPTSDVSQHQTIDDEPNIAFQYEETEIYIPEEDPEVYNSLEGVSMTLPPPIDLQRFDEKRFRGLKYITDDSELLILDRYNDAINTKSDPTTNPSNMDSTNQDGNGLNNIKENLDNNSSWNNAPTIDEKEKIQKVKKQLDDLSVQKNIIQNDLSGLEPILKEYEVILGGIDKADIEEITLNLNPKEIEKITNSLKDSGSPLATTVQSLDLSKSEDATAFFERVNKTRQNLNEKLSEVDGKISSTEKELQLLRKDEESSRNSIESRISNYTDSISNFVTFGSGSSSADTLSSLIGSGSLTKLNEFNLYETGDKLEKLDTKLKTLKLPQIGDLKTILAGGLSAKSLLSSLSSFSLPGMEELDNYKEIASQAESLYNGDLSIIQQFAGDLGAIDAVNSWQALKDAQKTLGPIVEEGKRLYDSGSKIYEEGKRTAESASRAYESYQSVKKNAENLWSEGGKLWNETKSEYDSLKRKSTQLWEDMKNLPQQAKETAMLEWNKLEEKANEKWNQLQKKGQDEIDKTKSEWKKLESDSNNLLSKGKELLGSPKISAANEAEFKLQNAKSAVEELKNTLPEEAIQKIESAAEKKQTFEMALNKAAAAQRSILTNMKNVNLDREPKKHFPKDYKPFSEWVLDKKNEVYLVEKDKTGKTVIMNKLEGDPTLLAVDDNGLSFRLDQNINLSDPKNTTSSLSPNNEFPTESTPFIVYRGATGKINTPTVSELESGNFKNFGLERLPTRFESHFDFGKSETTPVNLKKLFDGYLDSIISPIDVAFLLNPGNVGMFNNISPYGFGEGSELAAAVTFQKSVRKDVGLLFSKGGAGTKKQPNWAYNPEWAGLYINFLLDKNGIYQSDSLFLNFAKLSNVEKFVNEGYGLKLKNTAPLTEIPKSFPGAVICYFDKATRKGHAEILLRATLGGMITIGGNIKLPNVSKYGTTHGIRNYYSLKEFSPNSDVFIIKRGEKNSWTTNGRLDGRIKRTKIVHEYMSSVENVNSKKNSRLFAEAYDLLRGNISDTIYSRESTQDNNILMDNKVIFTDLSFSIHSQNNIYMSGSSIQTETISYVPFNYDFIDPGH